VRFCAACALHQFVVEPALSQAAPGLSAAACCFKSEAGRGAASLYLFGACTKASFRAHASPINKVTYQHKLGGKVQGCASSMMPCHSEQDFICNARRCGFCAAKHEHEDERPCKMLLPKSLLQGLHALQEGAQGVCETMTFPENPLTHIPGVTHLSSSCRKHRFAITVAERNRCSSCGCTSIWLIMCALAAGTMQ
jgi:hypothetical protein